MSNSVSGACIDLTSESDDDTTSTVATDDEEASTCNICGKDDVAIYQVCPSCNKKMGCDNCMKRWAKEKNRRWRAEENLSFPCPLCRQIVDKYIYIFV